MHMNVRTVSEYNAACRPPDQKPLDGMRVPQLVR
jgi:hypothetical protein